MLWHLAEVDARGLYRDEACSSMFAYCTDRLGFSENVAYKRITAARLARKFPAILRSIANGEIHLTGVKILAKVLTPENHERVLRQAAGMKSRGIEMLVAELAPKPDAPALVRKLPTPASSSEDGCEGRASGTDKGADVGAASRARPATTLATGAPSTSEPSRSGTAVPRERGSVAPLRPDRFKVQFSASTELRDKLQRAEELLGPMYGGGVEAGDIAGVVERALDALIVNLEKRKYAKTQRPQCKARATKPGTRTIPRRVRREVAQRDGERCTFVDGKGRRCAERRALEYHHERAFARGGDATVENIRLLCRAHNTLEAERDFGSEHMERARRGPNACLHQAQLPLVQTPQALLVRDGALASFLSSTRSAATSPPGKFSAPATSFGA